LHNSTAVKRFVSGQGDLHTINDLVPGIQ